jgi:hypothetical protein
MGPRFFRRRGRPYIVFWEKWMKARKWPLLGIVLGIVLLFGIFRAVEHTNAEQDLETGLRDMACRVCNQR